MTVRTKPTWNERPVARPVPSPGGRRPRRRSAARNALDRTMGRVAALPDGFKGGTDIPQDWDAELPPLLDDDFDHGGVDGALTRALHLCRSVRDEEEAWIFS